MFNGNYIKRILLFLLVSILLSTHLSAQGQPYLGQTLPGMQPVRFAPSIFTDEFHAPPIFSPDGTEVYWSFMDPQYPHIMYMKLENGIWSNPAVAPFCIGDYSDSPFITSDGTKLFFLAMSQPAYDENIYMVEKQNGQWGTPQILGNEINQFNPHWQVSVADNQNLFFGGRLSNYPGDIYFSEYINYNYTLAIKLDSAINTNNGFEGSPFIARDESYIIFDRVTEGTIYADLFISYKQNDGSWSNAVSMAEINTSAHELFANVSPDGRFMMFLSSRSGILLPYWVDAQIIYNYITDVDDEKTERVKSFQLHQNFPNPFNQITTIDYSVSETSHIKLEIYSVQGKSIKTLVNDFQTPGKKSVIWNGSDNNDQIVSSGIYYYKIQAGKKIQCKKMLCIK